MTAKPNPPASAVLSTAGGTEPSAYVKGAHAAAIRSRNEREKTALLARRDVVDAERRAAEDELADLAEALQLLSEPVAGAEPSNVTTLARSA